MNCFRNLIQTKFLRNVQNEIEQAHNTITMDPIHNDLPSFYPARLVDRKKLYNYYLKTYNFKSYLDDVDITAEDELVFYMQQNAIVWIASRHKDVISKAIIDTLYTTGELCLHNCKHIIQNKAVYAAMFDTRFCITPLTKN